MLVTINGKYCCEMPMEENIPQEEVKKIVYNALQDELLNKNMINVIHVANRWIDFITE